MKFKRIISAVLVLVMVTSAFAACSSSKKNSNIISADSTWFDSNEISLATQYQTNEYSYVFSQYVGMDDNGIILMTNATLEYPENVEILNYSDYDKYYIDYYSFDGELVNSICISNAFAEVSSGYGYMSDWSVNDDIITIKYDVYSEDTFVPVSYAFDVDYINGSYTTRPDNSTSENDWWTRYPDLNYEGSIDVGEYTVHKYWVGTENHYSYNLIIVNSEGDEYSIDLRQALPDLSIYDIGGGIRVSDDVIILSGNLEEGDAKYFEYIISSNTITDATESYTWLDSINMWSVTNIEGVGSFVYDSNGISKVDFDAQACEPFMTFAECNINRNTISNMNIINATDDSIILAGSVYDNSEFETFKVVTFTRADSNPNAGKTILKAASMDGYSNEIYESIYRFNNTSETCFMVVDDRYSIYDAMSEADYETWEEYQAMALNTYASLGDQLTVDIMAGEGPDILFNATNLSQLNNPDYLVDLSSLVDSDSYFRNIFEACSTNGALYQVPLTISTVGITTTTQYVDDDQIGFTFEQYLAFVDEVCNGRDPIQLTKTEYFTILHAAMNDLFRDGNSVNYNCDAFRALAAYIKDDVIEPDYSEPSYEDMAWEENYEEAKAIFGGIYSISSFFSNYGDRVGEVRFLGVPSYDARGPQFTIDKSVAVSAQASNLDGCMEFVNILLGDDMQGMMAYYGWGTPVNKDVLITLGEEALASHNQDVDMYLEWYTPEELQMYNLPSQHLDSTAIEYYIDIIEGCTTCAAVDVAVDLIIREEMQAYYAGQKDIDTVIDTMSNRITTYLNERG